MGSSIRNRFASSRVWTFAAVLSAVACTWAASAAPALAAEFEITEFGAAFTNAGEEREMRAGAHADLTTTIGFPTTFDSSGNELVVENPKDIVVDTPPGVIGDPTKFPTCPSTQFVNQGEALCDQDTQIGMATIRTSLGFGAQIPVPAQIYNLEPPHGVAARFGFNLLGVVTVLDGLVDAQGGYHIRVRSLEASQGIALSSVKVRLWGVPADSGHDDERGKCIYGGSCPSELEPAAFLSNPTACSQTPLEFRASANSWQNPARVLGASTSDDTFGEPMQFTACGLVPFTPDVSIVPTSHVAGQPTGLRVEMSIPQSDDPGGTAQANLRDATVTLPPGMTLSPPLADGLAVCSDADLGLGSTEPATCPAASKLGTARLETPVLEEPLTGSIYQRPQASNDPESGQMYRIAIELADPERGVDLKLPGSIRTSASDGRIVTTFENNPQLPFSNLKLDFKDGPRAPLVNPPTCGTATAAAELDAWSGAEVRLKSPFDIDSGCEAAAFAPSLEAGTANPVAGAATPFILRVSRPSGQPNISTIDATLPEGVLAKLAGVPVCADAAATAGTCPATSQIGTATLAVGAGSSPLYVPQAGKAPTGVYLAGPFKGAPYSLAVKVPSQAGPFDLGTVTVRNALFIDPVTTQVTTKSEPLPQILSGIPIEYRDIRIEITRPNFTVNPTSCEPMAVAARIGAANGGAANLSNRFQVGSCEDLAFKPKLSLKFSGPTHRSAHPALKATLTMPKGGANIGKAVVTLPKTEFLENAHIRTICTRVQYAADNCPKGSIYGYAKAWTPLLDKPLQGPVYLRSSNHTLPDLVASLDGQIHVDLAGRIDSPGGKIRNTFWAVPDAPVSKFVLTMQGGKKGLLANSEELCKAKPRAKAEFTGQNGKRSVSRPLVKLDCGGKKGR